MLSRDATPALTALVKATRIAPALTLILVLLGPHHGCARRNGDRLRAEGKVAQHDMDRRVRTGRRGCGVAAEEGRHPADGERQKGERAGQAW